MQRRENLEPGEGAGPGLTAVAALLYLMVLLAGLVARLLGTDLLRLRFDRAARSYWVSRNPPGPPPETFRHPF